eukprot:COSAG04_NODE_4898_length_1835_cov_2.555300_1_plen_210_part_00
MRAGADMSSEETGEFVYVDEVVVAHEETVNEDGVHCIRCTRTDKDGIVYRGWISATASDGTTVLIPMESAEPLQPVDTDDAVRTAANELVRHLTRPVRGFVENTGVNWLLGKGDAVYVDVRRGGRTGSLSLPVLLGGVEVGQEHGLFSGWQMKYDDTNPRHKFRTLGRVTRDPKYSPESFLLREPARSALRGTVYLIRQAVKQSTEWVR